MNLNLNARFKDTHIGNKGFTLVELLIVVAIMAILLAVAVPDFITATRLMQSKHQAKELSSAIKLAQSEAIRLRQQVILCPSNATQTTCATGTNWSNGWIIYVNNAVQEKLAIKQALSNGYTASSNVNAAIQFNAAGEPGSNNFRTITFSHTNNSSTDTIKLIINSRGRITITTN